MQPEPYCDQDHTRDFFSTPNTFAPTWAEYRFRDVVEFWNKPMILNIHWFKHSKVQLYSPNDPFEVWYLRQIDTAQLWIFAKKYEHPNKAYRD